MKRGRTKGLSHAEGGGGGGGTTGFGGVLILELEDLVILKRGLQENSALQMGGARKVLPRPEGRCKRFRTHHVPIL